MNKKIKILIGTVLGVCVLSVSVVVFFSMKNAPAIDHVAEETATDTTVEVAPINEGTTVPKIKVDAPQVIPEPTDSSAVDDLPPPAVTERQENGETIQTPNWDDQKKLPDDVDLNDPDVVPTYEGGTPKTPTSTPTPPKTTTPKTTPATTPPKTTTTPPATTPPKTTTPPASGGIPQNGDSKVIDGQEYGYMEGFGWVKAGDGNKGTIVDVGELSGEKVGH